ncbi:hypothetical protein TSAR_015972 [Trichomalopsis sarcophagae]|uniref:Uncharacterized protein n=1 Tax=Trichomalopsis sarcophagae TaxID=543379 RepID=A0A232ED46_9HYME|nr:hypothetical protein TSAR_015972 [Trichomalopsis sarcophagae]
MIASIIIYQMLQTGQKHMVTSLRPVKTRYCQVFLPSRVSTALEKDKEAFESMSYQAKEMKPSLTLKGENNIEFCIV